ncbi:hypothetical protein LV84_00484 [Algoriphagus ratkowskyi]|uniref:Uncharacterized protein n=1 Tax=Algoriphagus ratkowskyi TaxID=57028 RepID=A0A2W7RH23_9BACT|nr:hypothetical protein [Algoriphagus ratkowskyi]PZX60213.1 hypothetical protein LV84_00484 [Algoriphagus ratkowskyi]TXD78038.1 hypothetical protein ESW18_08290 [Algoriphagus ratkowskyi]
MGKRNKFTEKLSNKTTQKLEQIIGSDGYVEEAKMAAKWLLDEKGVKVNYNPKIKSTTKNLPWVLERNINPAHKSKYELRIIGFGIICLISALLLNFQTMTTFKSSLERLDGTIFTSKVFIENVSTRGRFGHEDKSRRATLSFSLDEFAKQFILRENIGEEYSKQEYYRISDFLKNSESVTVWVNRNQMENFEPKVYQIDVNGQTILAFDDVKTENSGIFMFLLILGLVSTCFGMYSRYPDRVRRVLRVN